MDIKQILAGLSFWLAATAMAYAQSGNDLISEARAFGATVGYGVSCGLSDQAIKDFTRANVGVYMPATGDPALDERMDQAFNRAMRDAATSQPPQGCAAIANQIAEGS